MKKSELKNGAVLETREGYNYFKMDNILIGLDPDVFGEPILLDIYNDDLIAETGRTKDDIMKVNNDVLDGNKAIKLWNSGIDFWDWTWERETLVKLTREEKQFLKLLNPKWHWIMIIIDGIILMEKKPTKNPNGCYNQDAGDSMVMWGILFPDDMFNVTKYGENIPYNIAGLLEEE